MTTSKPNYKFMRMCDECGTEFGAMRAHGAFCSTACRKVFHNRRAARGAELYDLVMEMRFNRDVATDEKLFTQLCSMASAFRTADKVYREGRKSWDPEAFRRTPLTYSKNHGDGR